MTTYQYILTNLDTLETKTLEVMVAGWQDTERNFYRHNTYHSVLRSDASAQRFVDVDGESFDKGGYYFVLDAYELRGVNAKVKFERKVVGDYTGAYEDDFIGMLNFSPDAGFNWNDVYVEAKLIESSKLHDFIVNDEIDYPLSDTVATNGNDITPFVSSPKSINLTAIPFILNADTNGTMDLPVTDFSEDGAMNVIYDREFTQNNLGNRYIEEGETIYVNNTPANTFLTVNYNIDYYIKWTLKGISLVNGYAIVSRILIQVYDESDLLVSAVALVQRADAGSLLEQQTTEYTYDSSVNSSVVLLLGVGYSIKFITRLTFIEDLGAFENTVTTDINVSAFNVIEFSESLDTIVDGWLTFEAFTRLIQLATGETDTSKLLDSEELGRNDSEFTTYPSRGDLSNLAIMSGVAIRNYPRAKTKINIKDYFQSLDRMGNIGLWYDKARDIFIIEKREEFYKDELIYSVGRVEDMNTKPYKNSYNNQILSGTNEKGNYEQYNGLFEYNIKSEHSVSFPVKGKENSRVLYNTDSVAMELASRLPYKTNNVDTKQDEKNYIVEVNFFNETIQNEDIGAFSGFYGIEKYYNGNYTPRKCLINNGNWIGAQLWKEDASSVIKFVNNAKDLDITYDGVNEQDDILKAELGTPLYYPEEITFTTPVTNEHIEILNTNPHGYIEVIDRSGVSHYGYILSVEIQDYKRIGKYTLLRANINR